MDRRTMLKSAAAAVATPATLLASTAAAMADDEHPISKAQRVARELSIALNNYEEGESHVIVHAESTGKGILFANDAREHEAVDNVTAIRRAFAESVSTHDALYGPGSPDHDWSYCPKNADHYLAKLRFWNEPCRSLEAVAEKVNLILSRRDMIDDLRERFDYGTREERYYAYDLFLSSLIDDVLVIDDSYEAQFRQSFAASHLKEVEEKNTREERRAQEEAAAEAEKAEARARQAAEEKARYARMSPEQRKVEDESHRALQEFLRVHRQEQDWKAANPEFVV